MTRRNPNVFLEVGLAFGLEKRVVFLSQNPDDIPFDTRTFRTLIYNPLELSDLKNKIRILMESIKTLPMAAPEVSAFKNWYNKIRKVKEVLTEPLIEIFIGPAKETQEWLPVTQENLGLMRAAPYVLENESVEPRRGYFEFTSRSPQISATIDSIGFFHSIIPLRWHPEQGKYYLNWIVYDIGEILLFVVRVMKKKAIEIEQQLRLDFHGIKGLKISPFSDRFSIRSFEYSFSREQESLSYEKTFNPKEKWVYFFNLICEIYKDICIDLGIIGMKDETIKQNVREIISTMHYLRTAYPSSGLQDIPLEEFFKNTSN